MNPIVIQIELPEAHAWAYAQFLKRVSLDDYQRRAADDAEAWAMLHAGDLIRRALAEQGVAPR